MNLAQYISFRRHAIVFLFTTLSFVFAGCPPPYASVLILGWNGDTTNLRWVHLDGGGVYTISKAYSVDSLNNRMFLATDIEIELRNSTEMVALTAKLSNSLLSYTVDDSTHTTPIDRVRRLTIYNHSPSSRAFVRAAIGAGILGGLAALAYIPPNPPNEPPPSTILLVRRR